jgi:uncharacterized membrane protein YphA (DoxX/SURF4 family)
MNSLEGKSEDAITNGAPLWVRWTTPPVLEARRATIIWALGLILALIFLYQGAIKVVGTRAAIDEFERWMFPQWFRLFIGASELLLTVLLMIPRVRFFGALGAVALMLGAIPVNVRAEEYGFLPVPLFVLASAAYLAWTLRPQPLRSSS